jgi:ion channel-forming bestrophin family protein
MYTRRNYGFWITFRWSAKPFYWGLLYSAGVIGLHFLARHWWGSELAIPWGPVSVIGIAVAFYLGFKNNASYDRTWEARKIWGGIVNSSRSFGAAVLAFVQGNDSGEVRRQLIHRHLAWLIALRFQLRLAREWEHAEERVHGSVYQPTATEKYRSNLCAEMSRYMTDEEAEAFTSKTNGAAQILAKQSQELQRLRNEGYFDDFRHIELQKLVQAFYDDQGRSERIKNFPFPRQYASAALWLTVIFSGLIPFSLIDLFDQMSDWKQWLAVPLSALIIWIFFLMEKIGDYSENPFEGSYNDVPISTIARGIEIDLLEMLGDPHVPKPFANDHGFVL